MESDKHDAQWAIDLLSPDPYYKPHLIAKYALQIPSFVVGPGFACYINYIKGFKPFASKFSHKLIISILCHLNTIIICLH